MKKINKCKKVRKKLLLFYAALICGFLVVADNKNDSSENIEISDETLGIEKKTEQQAVKETEAKQQENTLTQEEKEENKELKQTQEKQEEKVPKYEGVILATGFEGYPENGPVAGTEASVSGDIGLTKSPWDGEHWSWFNQGLSYADKNVIVNGGKRCIKYTGSKFQYRQVNISPANPIKNATIFIRFLVKLETVPQENAVSAVQLVLNNDISNRNNNIYTGFGMIVGGPSFSNFDCVKNNFFLHDGDSFQLSDLPGPTVLFGGEAKGKGAEVNMLVARLNWNSETGKYDKVDVWVNPAHDSLMRPDSSINFSEDIKELSKIVIRGGANSAGPACMFDELVISTNWDDVVTKK